MASSDPHVRGMAFLGVIRFVKERGAPGALEQIVAQSPPATQQALETRINGLSLYRYEAFAGFLESVAQFMGEGDPNSCQALGQLAARHDLDTIFRVYAEKPAPRKMIKACTPIWGMYTDHAGRMEAVSVEPENTVLRIYDFPTMHPAHCRLMEGWMVAAMDVVGVQILPGAGETQCMSRGGPYHEFSCQWKQRQ